MLSLGCFRAQGWQKPLLAPTPSLWLLPVTLLLFHPQRFQCPAGNEASGSSGLAASPLCQRGKETYPLVPLKKKKKGKNNHTSGDVDKLLLQAEWGGSLLPVVHMEPHGSSCQECPKEWQDALGRQDCLSGVVGHNFKPIVQGVPNKQPLGINWFRPHFTESTAEVQSSAVHNDS